MAAIEYRGLNAVTNFDLSRYIKWLKPNGQDNKNSSLPSSLNTTSSTDHEPIVTTPNLISQELGLGFFHNQQHTCSSSGETLLAQPRPATATSALGLLLQSSKFKEMMEMTSAVDSPPESSEPPQYTFPDDIQTYFDCQETSSYGDGDDIIFGELNSLMPPMFQCDF